MEHEFDLRKHSFFFGKPGWGLGTNRQGDIVYKVIVTPDSQDKRLQWNMTASVTVKTQ